MDQNAFVQARHFAFSDIRREISLARATESPGGRTTLEHLGVVPGAGNFLAALGLLCYTEFGGKLKFNDSKASKNFNQFFNLLGSDYAMFRAAHNVYGVFRCGLAHEYYVKRSCVIAALANGEPMGLGVSPDGRYWFVVERYFQDLQRAFDALEHELFGDIQVSGT
jgi:hypothetical protein